MVDHKALYEKILQKYSQAKFHSKSFNISQFLSFIFIQSKIFVVDSSDSSHLNEAAQSLAKVLRNSTLAGLPLLVLANKQDLSDAKDLVEVLKIAITFYSCYLQQYGSKN